MAALLFGSIGSIADTSELQRESFNEAFSAHDLDWRWERDEYTGLLEKSGGAQRIREYADDRGEQVDADAVHRTKSELFQRKLADEPIEPRPGVVEAIRDARDRGSKIALVTTTSADNVTALMSAVANDLDRGSFDLIVDSSEVDSPKPDPASYRYALERLGEEASDCVAIEDNVKGVEAAVAAGIDALAFPNENTAEHSFDGATRVVSELDPAELRDKS